jgi:hypothetical protein
MPISIVDVINFEYPGQFAAGNVSFVYDNTVPGGINIESWNISGVQQPTIASLVALFPQYQTQYNNEQALAQLTALIRPLLDSTAQLQGNNLQYYDAMSCISYYNSTNQQYANEAKTFIAWRDSIYTYAINIITQVNAGKMTVPTSTQFIAGIAPIVWPVVAITPGG